MPNRLFLGWIVLLGLCSIVVSCVLLLFVVEFDREPLSSSVPVHSSQQVRNLPKRKALDFEHGVKPDDVRDLNTQIDELESIKTSVRNELRELDGKRWEFMKEASLQAELLEKMKKDLSTSRRELSTIRSNIAKACNKEAENTASVESSTQSPIIILPQSQQKNGINAPLLSTNLSLNNNTVVAGCTFSTCFDLSSCTLLQSFSVHVYNSRENVNIVGAVPETDITELLAELQNNKLHSTDPSAACLHVLIVGRPVDYGKVEEKLKSLEYWKDGGLNHLIIEHSSVVDSRLYTVNTGRAMVASSYFRFFRKGFDVLSPPIVANTHGRFRESLPLIMPTQRPKLLYFHGDCSAVGETPQQALRERLLQLKKYVRNEVDIEVSCVATDKIYPVKDDECSLCDTLSERFTALTSSKFALIPGANGVLSLARLIEALRSGAIPVLLDTDHNLPIDTFIDWNLAVVRIPPGLFNQLHYVLRSIDETAMQQFRRQGRFLYETYFRSPFQAMNTILAAVRSRTLHPAPAISSSTVYKSIKFIPSSEYIPSSPVINWRHNFTSPVHSQWNNPPGPFYSFPTSPLDPIPLSGSQYATLTDSQLTKLPPHIVLAGGITGPNFEDHLLGNSPGEQFTVVILTYQRNQVLMEALERLENLQHLHKVVVVWNNLEDIPTSLVWPSIDVPIEVVHSTRNSLNNRFIPYDAIETEAILSVDDDVYLRHDEIQFGFRVWREARDRIVGFPGRFHAFDIHSRQWLYNSNYTCELSMVLTGAAFFHKYYSYLYTFWMPAEVRGMVDQYINCEDIAMNFLVSHISRKPPLKVTSRWTFRCPGCPDTLSSDETHFHERHHCINYLVKVFGYMPLLYTQFRVDSVLFKTRLPSELEKCFKFI